jgi:hypothetical protein
MPKIKSLFLSLLISLVNFSMPEQTLGQHRAGRIDGRVVDEVGAVITGASVTLSQPGAADKTINTDDTGRFRFTNLAQGTYSLRATASGFGDHLSQEIKIGSLPLSLPDIVLKVEISKQELTVQADQPVSTDPDNNAGAITLKGPDLEALPDDPDELTDVLQALAGASAGPGGGQIYIDGFSGGRMPPRDSIREIRINQNPFSAEYDRPGFGRIEVLTKPGSENLHGQFSFEFEDESFNSRNPLALNQPPFQIREYDGNIGGPIIPNRASAFVDFERQATDDNALINAVILDQNLNIVPFSLAVVAPNRETEFNPRLDIQLNQNNTLSARYGFEKESSENAGIGDFNLLSRAFRTADTEHLLQLTETAIINQSIINETRFQLIRRRSTQEGDNSVPTIRVLDAFTGGGAQVGTSFSNEDRWELQNNTSWTRNTHALKAGLRLRGVRLSDFSPRNFGGTFTFTSLEQYRDTLTAVPGERPTQFTIAGGNPLAQVNQVDLGLFFQDDWRLRQNLTFSFGLRYENQTNINSHLNLSPRLGFAWSPGASRGSSKTVIRGGFGIFYDRIGESLTLDAERFNGTNQLQFVVTDPNVLSEVVFSPDGTITNIPTTDILTSFALPQTIRQLDRGLEAPYLVQSAIGFERQLPFNTTASLSYVHSRYFRLLRSRSVNRFLGDVGVPNESNIENIFQYESTGRLRQDQLIVNLRARIGSSLSTFVNYTMNNARSDTDGANFFPADSENVSGEYGRSSLDIRHQISVGGSLELPYDIRLSPLLIARTGTPFNITTGRDTNADNVFTERPAFATDLTRPSVVVTHLGAFDLDPLSGQEIIPRNFGEGPGFVQMNLRIGKTFGFGNSSNGNSAAQNDQGRGRRREGGPWGGSQGRGGLRDNNRGRGGSTSGDSRFRLELSLNIRNILNRTNLAPPVGNLSSPFFGRSVSTIGGFGRGGGGGSSAAGNRRIEVELRFRF